MEHAIVEQTAIRKKQFYGNKALRSYEIPDDIVEIGDWAFAGCSNLRKITLPYGVEKIGKEAFAGCDKLEKVQIRDTLIREPYANGAAYAKNEHCGEGEITEESETHGNGSDETAEAMMAMALRYFQGLPEILTAARKGDKAFLSAWDQSCHRFLERPDEEGFRPFLAGGEEDYGDEEKERILYCRNRRLIKAKVVILRLLDSKAKCEYYFSYLQKNDMVLECLKSIWQQPKVVLSVLEDAGVLTRESCKVVLEELPEKNVEMRALLLQRIGADLNTVSDQLWL